MHDIFSYFLNNLQMIWIFSSLGCLKQAAFSISNWGGPCHSGVQITAATLLSAIPEQVQVSFTQRCFEESYYPNSFCDLTSKEETRYISKKYFLLCSTKVSRNFIFLGKPSLHIKKLKSKICNWKFANVQVYASITQNFSQKLQILLITFLKTYFVFHRRLKVVQVWFQ